ncbi:hypothetical protein HIM_09087 [Hirsutella minnesotensis 3608]|uniref:Uncharacterized protein n=1 Tax=Hirsutella minnesotensis 3608 TaxID=1043627 RepID=A0A0F8A3B7_9HYPO|nr:hypothetical protein HIM_09087 [Hirsutella minnesotensis 3608]
MTKKKSRKAATSKAIGANLPLETQLSSLPSSNTGKDLNMETGTITKYDMYASKLRLHEHGFHADVTKKTPEQLMRVAGLMWPRFWMEARPTKEEFLGGIGPRGGEQHTTAFVPRHLTRALLMFREELGGNRQDNTTPNSDADDLLVRLLNTVDIGGVLSGMIFAQGFKAVHSVAMTSTKSWASLSSSAASHTKIWDFMAADFCVDGPAPIFIALTPEYTIGDLKDTNLYDPYGLQTDNSMSAWCAEAMTMETEIYFSISQLHRRLSKPRKTEPRYGPLTDELVAYTKLLTNARHIHGSDQFKSSPPGQVYDPPAYFAANRLRHMLEAIHDRRSAIKVLHFNKTPFFDRRLLAVILRSCPNVEMVGVYDCPLIHFGDVICLLDLIHEINVSRGKKGRPLITAFDFFPRYHKGMPFQDTRADTYGITWGPDSLEVVQRGFFGIVLKAFMKARAMKIDLLFTKGKAFCDFLYSVPNYSLAVATFLDGLYRYADLARPKRGKAKSQNAMRQALYDLLKPVRLGLENVEQDWPKYYRDIMGEYLLFCASCGYEMLQEFFTTLVRRDARPQSRICAGCILRRRLDLEADHLKQDKVEILNNLFPSHSGTEFNREAPLLKGVGSLLRLKSTTSIRPAPPGMVVDNEGNLYQPQYMQPLVRDRKVHFDCLHGLPSLGDVVGSKKRWLTVTNRCHKLDMRTRLIQRLTQEGVNVERLQDVRPRSRADGGMPDHAEERQPRRPLSGQDGEPSHSFRSLVNLETFIYNKGWL